MSRSAGARAKTQTSISPHLTPANVASGAAADAAVASSRPNVVAKKMATGPPASGRDKDAPGASSGLTVELFKSEMAKMFKSEMAKMSAQMTSHMEVLRGEMAKQRSEITADVDSLLKTTLAPIHKTLQGLTDQAARHATTIVDMETSLSDHEGRLAKVEEEVETWKARAIATSEANASLELAVEDLICRNKRQNLRLVSIPEGEEGPNPIDYVTTMFKELLGAEPNTQLQGLELDRAHRSLGLRRDGGPPRAIIVRFHRYIQKELVLEWAKKNRNIAYKDFTVRIYEDFSPSIVKKRATFNHVKSLLYKEGGGTRFGVVYPARLRITMGVHSGTFDSAEEAELFYQKHKSG